jgi:PHD/YefM family antitoxin component YafN of YafNO toxin-antitoxin module
MKEPRMIVNEDGKPVSVILSISTYKKILDELEELEEIRAYDKAKKSADEILPFEEALDKFKRKDV